MCMDQVNANEVPKRKSLDFGVKTELSSPFIPKSGFPFQGNHRNKGNSFWDVVVS